MTGFGIACILLGLYLLYVARQLEAGGGSSLGPVGLMPAIAGIFFAVMGAGLVLLSIAGCSTAKAGYYTDDDLGCYAPLPTVPTGRPAPSRAVVADRLKPGETIVRCRQSGIRFVYRGGDPVRIWRGK